MAIVLPARGLADASLGRRGARRSSSEFAAERLQGEDAAGPEAGRARARGRSAGERPIGYVLALRVVRATACRRSPSTARRSCARPRWRRWPRSRSPRPATRSADEVRGSLLEDLRAGRVEAAETARRAAGSAATSRAARVALVAEVRSSRPRHAAALIAQRAPRARSPSRSGTRIYAILPARGGDEAPERTQASARTPRGPAAHRTGRPPYSSFCADPGRARPRGRARPS